MRSVVPQGLQPLLEYFDSTYVSGELRATRHPAATTRLRLRMHRNAPMFPPSTWNVFHATLTADDRTNNVCEAWNQGFTQLVGHYHPSIWTTIDALRKDSAMASMAIEMEARGMPPKKRVKKATKELQERVHTLCRARADNAKSVQEFLRGVGHTIRFF